MNVNRMTGDRGEEAAASYLIKRGYRILHRNWRSGRYELDLVAARRGMLCFVEVKCRREGSLTAPHEALTAAKSRSMMIAARAYLAEYPTDGEIRFDLISVRHCDGRYTVEHIPAAITPAW